MKKIFLIVIAATTLSSLANAQHPDSGQIDADIQKLVDLKIDYEAYRNNDSKKGAVLTRYKNQIYKVKKSPDLYLKYINYALKNHKTQPTEETLPYKYIPGTGGGYINSHWYKIKKTDFYRVIKYSLFKRNDSVLPENFRGLPVVDEKNYNGYDKAKRVDFKKATKFLRANLALAAQEIKFIRNDDHQVHVLDMKKYLDTNGLSKTHKDFVKWAIDYLIKYPEVSLAYLDNVYDAIRYQDYIPRDKPAN